MIKAMAAPYVGIKFMPTGGINAKNLEDYLSFDKIICCGGSWMVKGELVNNGEFDKIRDLTAEARKLVDSIRKIIGGIYTYSYSQKTGSCMKTVILFFTHTLHTIKNPINPNSPLSCPSYELDNINKRKKKQIKEEGME